MTANPLTAFSPASAAFIRGDPTPVRTPDEGTPYEGGPSTQPAAGPSISMLPEAIV
ncbi:MAG: hypothetical protein N3E46_03910 [Gemmataceae bacterium]|nr:hypothetical protein [Gemmataceae bacterium]